MFGKVIGGLRAVKAVCAKANLIGGLKAVKAVCVKAKALANHWVTVVIPAVVTVVEEVLETLDGPQPAAESAEPGLESPVSWVS